MFAKLGLKSAIDKDALSQLEDFLNALADGRPAEVPALGSRYPQLSGIEQALHRLAAGPDQSALAGQASTLTELMTDSQEVVNQLLSSTRDTISFADTASSKGNEISARNDGLASSIEQMGVGIKEVAEQTNSAARIVTKAKGLAENAVEHVQLLGRSSLEIDEITKVIESVAEQTNLLALNATIEAARAGEQGKGFAVVASEVKDLARESASQVTSIQAKIKAIQTGTQSAVGYIQEIADIIRHLEDISVAIASAVEEQAAVSREIGLHAQDTAEDSKVISSNMQEVVQYNQLAAEIIESLQFSYQDLIGLAKGLKQSLG